MEYLNDYHKHANILNVDSFTNDVFDSFKKALSEKHYVILCPVDLDMYYTPDEHKEFREYGYYRGGVEERYFNVFFGTDEVVKNMASVLNYEEMKIDKVVSERTGTNVFVVTLNGIENSNYFYDHQEEDNNN